MLRVINLADIITIATMFSKIIVKHSSKFEGCVACLICLSDPPKVKYNCANFHHCRICVRGFKETGRLFAPIRDQLLEGSSRVNDVYEGTIFIIRLCEMQYSELKAYIHHQYNYAVYIGYFIILFLNIILFIVVVN